MKFRNLFLVAAVLLLCNVFSAAQNLPAPGTVYASDYGQWQGKILAGPNTTGAVTYTMQVGYIVAKNGRTITPFSTSAPLLIGTSNQETATPSAVSGCVPVGQNSVTCNITITVSNAHGVGDVVQSGSFGLVEAILDQNAGGGGNVVVDNFWANLGGSNTTITNVTAATPKVWIADERGPGPVTWCGKSGTGSAAYSCSNSDIAFTVTLAANTATKTLSQTYSVAPICTAVDQTTAQLVKVAPTTSTVVVSDTVGATDVVAVHCAIVK